jgi:hypothetical protein
LHNSEHSHNGSVLSSAPKCVRRWARRGRRSNYLIVWNGFIVSQACALCTGTLNDHRPYTLTHAHAHFNA